MVFVDDPASPVLDRARCPPPPRRAAAAARRAGGGRRRRRVVGRRAGWPAGPGRVRSTRPPSWCPTVACDHRGRTGDRGHRGLRPGQGGPPRVGGPEAHRAGGGPDRAPPVPAARWSAGTGSGPSGRWTVCDGWPGRPRPSAGGPWLPEVPGVSTLAELAGSPGRPRAWPSPAEAPPSLAQPVVAVGPEGGWDDDELARCAGHGGAGSHRPAGRDGGRRRRHAPVRSPHGLVRDPCVTTLREQNYYVERQGLLLRRTIGARCDRT